MNRDTLHAIVYPSDQQELVWSIVTFAAFGLTCALNVLLILDLATVPDWGAYLFAGHAVLFAVWGLLRYHRLVEGRLPKEVSPE